MACLGAELIALIVAQKTHFLRAKSLRQKTFEIHEERTRGATDMTNATEAIEKSKLEELLSMAPADMSLNQILILQLTCIEFYQQHNRLKQQCDSLAGALVENEICLH